MGLVRSSAPKSALEDAPSREVLIAQLHDVSPDARRRAVRDLAADDDAIPALMALLLIESERPVRDALFESLLQPGSPAIAALLAPFLNSDDADLRGRTVDALKRLGDDAVAMMDELLENTDPDIRLLAIEVMRVWPFQTAVPRLAKVIANDAHINVCGAAVDVATEVGTIALLPPLQALRVRFAHEPFLVFAVDVACDRISASPLQQA